MLVTIANFTEPQEAHMLRGRLWAEGIFAVVSHAYHVGNSWAFSIGLGGAKVQVRRVDYPAARLVVRACNDDEFRRQLEVEVGDLDDRRCPNCGSTELSKRRPILQGALAIIVTFAATILPPWQWLYFCNVCGAKFKQRYGLIGKVRSFQFPMTFAEAELPDSPTMQELYADTLDSWSEDGASLLVLAEDRRGWVCRIDGELRGFSVIQISTQHLIAQYVDPEFERNGIGRQLHNFAVEWLFGHGAEVIWTTAAPYTKAQKFFRAAGWKLVDGEPNGDYRLELDAAIWRERRAKF